MYRPWIGRRVGIEMETSTRRTNGTALTERDLTSALAAVLAPGRLNQRSAGYYHSNGTTWDVKTDSSCGWEVASPALEFDSDGECAELKAACNALASLSPSVNRACGLHVHVDLSDWTWQDLQKLVALWARYEPFFFSLTPTSRRDNQYTRAMRRSDASGRDTGKWAYTRAALAATDEDTFRRHLAAHGKYTSLNTEGWWRHGRVEFRLHSGTIKYDKIRNWALLLLALVSRVKNESMPAIGMLGQSTAIDHPTELVCKVLGLIPTPEVPEVPPTSTRLVGYVTARRAQFAATPSRR